MGFNRGYPLTYELEGDCLQLSGNKHALSGLVLLLSSVKMLYSKVCAYKPGEWKENQLF